MSLVALTGLVFMTLFRSRIRKFEVNFSDWSEVRDTSYMFEAACYGDTYNYNYLNTDCENLDIDLSLLDLRNLRISSLQHYEHIFRSIDMSYQDFDKLEEAAEMFSYATVSNEISLSELYLPRILYLEDFFYGVNSFITEKELDSSFLNLLDVSEDGDVDLSEFSTSIDVYGWDFRPEWSTELGLRDLDIDTFYQYVSNVEELNFSGWERLDLFNSISARYLVAEVTNTSIDLTGFDFSRVYRMNGIFSEIDAGSIDITLGEMDVSNVTRMDSLF